MKILLSKRNEESLTVKLIYFSQEDVTKIKQLSGRKWLPEEAVWSVPYTLGVIEQLLDLFNERETQVKNELIARGYSSKTIKPYCGQVERFYGYTVQHGGSWNDRTVHHYSLYLLDRQRSHTYVNQAISAIKFYVHHVLKQQECAPYVRPKKEKKLPPVLSRNEVKQLLESVYNLKH